MYVTKAVGQPVINVMSIVVEEDCFFKALYKEGIILNLFVFPCLAPLCLYLSDITLFFLPVSPCLSVNQYKRLSMCSVVFLLFPLFDASGLNTLRISIVFIVSLLPFYSIDGE